MITLAMTAAAGAAWSQPAAITAADYVRAERVLDQNSADDGERFFGLVATPGDRKVGWSSEIPLGRRDGSQGPRAYSLPCSSSHRSISRTLPVASATLVSAAP